MGQCGDWARAEQGLDTEVVMRLVDWSQILEVCEF